MNIERSNICDLCTKECKSYKGMKIHRFHCLKKQNQTQAAQQQQIKFETVNDMSVNPVYIEAPSSKQTTIQLEMTANCLTEDINAFICSNSCSEQSINNPACSAYFAFLIEQVKSGIQGIQAQKNTPFQLNYSVCDRIFTMTVSFVTDNTLFKAVIKMLAEKCFLKDIKPVVQMISRVDSEFVKSHGKDVVENAVRCNQRGVSIYVMSKMPKEKFEQTIATKVISDTFSKAQSSLQIPVKNPIPNTPIEINLDIYSGISIDIITLPPIYLALILAFLNGQSVRYSVQKRELKIVKGDLTLKGNTALVKFIKNMLAFTKEGKYIKYNNLTTEQKSMISNSDYTAKQTLKYQKKCIELIQTLSQSGGVPMDLLISMRKPLESHVFNPPAIERIKNMMKKVSKSK